MKKVLGALALVLVLVLGCAAIASADGVIDPKDIPEGQVVNWGDLCSITRIAGHTIKPFDESCVKVWPTCTEFGVVEFDCIEKEGEVNPKTEAHFHIVRVYPLGHDWASEQGAKYAEADEKPDGWPEEWGNVIKKPTCTEKGLAQDVCLRCGIDREVYREIAKLPHEYTAMHEPYYKDPTCTETGLAQHECKWCGKLKPNETVDQMIEIPKLDHSFTDWKFFRYATCCEYGAAERMCVWCGMHQKLGLSKDVDNGIAEVTGELHDIQDKWGRSLLNLVDGVKLLNPNYKVPDSSSKYWDSDLGALAFKSRGYYNEWLDTINFDYTISKKWLKDCYTRVITFSCPYCHGECPNHPDFVIYQVAPFTIAHIWKTVPDEVIEPTCKEDGLETYYCIYDGYVHGHDGETFTDEYGNKVKDPQKYTKKVPALGHDWSPLKIERTYEKDGQTWNLWVATCKRCGATQEEAKLAPEVEEPAQPHGFVLCDDGNWRLYDNGKVCEDFTGFYDYDGATFFLNKGVLTDVNGLQNPTGDKWVFMSHGRLINVTRLVEFDGEWFFVVDGELDTNKNGIYEYDGGYFVFAAGRLVKELNGLWQEPETGIWWFISNGQVQTEYKGVALYDGAFFLLNYGRIDTLYEGTLWYDGAEFKVVEGQLYAV